MAGAALVAAARSPSPAEARAQDAARDMYTRAMAQERTVRDEASQATADADAPRRRRCTRPSSAASGERLLRQRAVAGGQRLAPLAYERFGDEADRKTATRLFDLLAEGYPASKLVAAGEDCRSDLDTASRNTASAAIPPISPLPASTTPAPASAPVFPATRSERDLPRPVRLGLQRPGEDPALDLAIPAAGSAALLRQIKRTVLPDGVRMTVDLDAEISYHQEEIENPRRVFFDLKNVKASPSLQDASLKFDDDVVKEVRLGRHPQNTTRLVVDLDGVSSYSVYPLYGPYRLVIDFRRARSPTAPVPAPPPTAPAVARCRPPMRQRRTIGRRHAVEAAADQAIGRPQTAHAARPEPPLPSTPAPAARRCRPRPPTRTRTASSRCRASSGWASRASSSTPATAGTIRARTATGSTKRS